jgi:hypothetical protein
MALEVPDLAVAMGVDVLNGGLARVTGAGLDDKPTSAINLGDLPHGSQSMALGVTRLLYYWFPGLQGRTDVVTLHLEALFLIINPLRERAERIYTAKQQVQNPQGVQNGNENKAEKTVEPAAVSTAAAEKPVAVKTRSKKFKRKR